MSLTAATYLPQVKIQDLQSFVKTKIFFKRNHRCHSVTKCGSSAPILLELTKAQMCQEISSFAEVTSAQFTGCRQTFLFEVRHETDWRLV